VTRRRVVHGRELDVGTQVDAGQPLQQLRGTAFDEPRAPVEDEVLLEPRRLDLGAFNRKGTRGSRATFRSFR